MNSKRTITNWKIINNNDVCRKNSRKIRTSVTQQCHNFGGIVDQNYNFKLPRESNETRVTWNQIWIKKRRKKKQVERVNDEFWICVCFIQVVRNDSLNIYTR